MSKLTITELEERIAELTAEVEMRRACDYGNHRDIIARLTDAVMDERARNYESHVVRTEMDREYHQARANEVTQLQRALQRQGRKLARLKAKNAELEADNETLARISDDVGRMRSVLLDLITYNVGQETARKLAVNALNPTRPDAFLEERPDV